MGENSGKGFERSGAPAKLAAPAGGDLERSCTSSADIILSAPDRDGIERIEARFHGNGFSPHRHDTYALGVTVSGVQTFSYRGASRFSKPGRLIILHPDELHDGGAGTEAGLVYRMIYIAPELISAALEGRAACLPFVTAPVLSDATLRTSLVEALFDLDTALAGLERDALLGEIAQSLLRLSDTRLHKKTEKLDRRSLAECRAYLAAYADENVLSIDLEKITGLDRFTLARQFRSLYGTSPHRYLLQRRLSNTRSLIAAGETLAAAAASAGFADQSHMTRHFSKTYGMTPGRFQRLVNGFHSAD